MSMNNQVIVDGIKAAQIIAPLLGPYGPAVLVGLKIVERVEPAIYAAIVAFIAKGDPTPEQTAEFLNNLALLKNPGEAYKDA